MKVLIADDHELFLQGLELVLKTHFEDISITAVKDYTELFEAIENNSYNLVITDLAMPGANSMDGIIKMHELLKDTPIIVISAVLIVKSCKKQLKSGFRVISRNLRRMI